MSPMNWNRGSARLLLRPIAFIFVALFAATVTARAQDSAPAAKRLAIGATVPDFALRDMSGAERRLGGHLERSCAAVR